MPVWLPPLPIAAPLLAAAILAGANRHLPRALADSIALAAAVIAAAASFWLLLVSRSHFLVYWMGGWQPHPSPWAHGHIVALGIALAIGPLGAGLACFAAVLVLLALVYARCYLDSAGALFHVLMLTFLAGMCGFSLTGDLFNLFVWFELMSAAAFALCGYKTEAAGPIEGSLNFAVTNTVASAMILSGIGLLYGRTGALNFAQIGDTLSRHPHPHGLLTVAFTFLLCGFLTKAAIVPFHFWLADAHAVAPTPVCVLFSGVMVELGLYAVARIYWAIFAPTFAPGISHVRAVLVAAGCLTAVIGAILTFVQRHLKRLLAYSTISHMGLMLIGLGLLSAPALAGLALYVLGHGAAKAALFMSAGIVLHKLGGVDAVKLHGRGREICGLGGVILVVAAVLGLNGLPPFATADGIALIHRAAAALGYGWTSALFWFAPILTGGAVLRMVGKIYFGWGPQRPLAPAGEGKSDEKRETRSRPPRQPVPLSMWIPMLLLILFGFLLDSWPGFVPGLTASARAFLQSPLYAARVLHAAPMPHLVAVAAPGIGELWPSLAASLCTLLLAAVALFPPRLAGVRPLAGLRAFSAAMAGLRRLHSGRLGDYVAWLTLGAAAIGGVFVLWRP